MQSNLRNNPVRVFARCSVNSIVKNIATLVSSVQEHPTAEKYVKSIID